MKKQFVILLLIPLLLLSGCSPKKEPYVFCAPAEEVVRIELLHNRNEYGSGTDKANIDLIYTLKEEEIPAFMSSLHALETDRKLPPEWGYGDYIAKVSYSNGDVEMFGTLHFEHIPADHGENYLYGYGSYRFENKADFIQLLEQYCELPDEV